MVFSCCLCYGFSLSNLVNHGRYITPCHPKLSVETPGFSLTDKPGALSFELLIDAWHFAIQRFVYKKDWSKDQVTAYLSMLCINKATIAHFTLCCCNFLLVQNLDATPKEYNDSMSAYVNHDRTCHPGLYSLPAPPSAWSIGELGHRVETIMHLAMNTQKAVFKLVLHWASSMDQGPALKKKLKPLLESVKVLRLPFIPCRSFKNAKFGGLPCIKHAIPLVVSISYGQRVCTHRSCPSSAGQTSFEVDYQRKHGMVKSERKKGSR
jgi:hypothetical protein